jgi:hypothetical protein
MMQKDPFMALLTDAEYVCWAKNDAKTSSQTMNLRLNCCTPVVNQCMNTSPGFACNPVNGA